VAALVIVAFLQSQFRNCLDARKNGSEGRSLAVVLALRQTRKHTAGSMVL
jgi:hypothetical protein